MTSVFRLTQGKIFFSEADKYFKSLGSVIRQMRTRLQFNITSVIRYSTKQVHQLQSRNNQLNAATPTEIKWSRMVRYCPSCSSIQMKVALKNGSARSRKWLKAWKFTNACKDEDHSTKFTISTVNFIFSETKSKILLRLFPTLKICITKE